MQPFVCHRVRLDGRPSLIWQQSPNRLPHCLSFVCLSVFSARQHVDVGLGCMFLCALRLPPESAIHPRPVFKMWRRRQSCFQKKKKKKQQTGSFLSSFFRLSFVYISAPSRQPLSTHMSYMWSFGLNFPTSGALSSPTGPYNTHLYITPQEQFSCLSLDECCKVLCGGGICGLN